MPTPFLFAVHIVSLSLSMSLILLNVSPEPSHGGTSKHEQQIPSICSSRSFTVYVCVCVAWFGEVEEGKAPFASAGSWRSNSLGTDSHLTAHIIG